LLRSPQTITEFADAIQFCHSISGKPHREASQVSLQPGSGGAELNALDKIAGEISADEREKPEQ